MNSQYFNQVKVTDSNKRFVDKSLAIGDEIIRLLEEKGMTQRQLAEVLGKKESQISKWLTGLHNFTLKTITEIEAVLGEDLLLTTTIAKKLHAKAPVVLHATVVDQSVFKHLREAEQVVLSSEQKVSLNQLLTPQPKAEEFSFSDLQFS